MENIKIKGLIRLTMEDVEKGTITKELFENFVSKAMKRLAVGESMGRLLGPNIGSNFGTIMCKNNKQYTPYTNSNYWIQYNTLPDSVTLVLLNIPSGETYSATSKYLKIINSSGTIDYTKVTGYSTGNYQSSGSLEGIEDGCGAAVMNDLDVTGKSWLFDTGVATGTFNAIALVPGFGTSPFNAFMPMKCVSNQNMRISGDASAFGYIRPGVKNSSKTITDDNEIILFYTHRGTSIWRYNIITGETSQVGPNEDAYVFASNNYLKSTNIGNQIYTSDYPDYLFFISGTTLYKYSIVDGSAAASRQIGYAAADADKGEYGLWYDGTYIWVSSYYNSTTNTGRAYISCIDPSNLNVVSKVNNESYSGWGNLPTGWDARQTCMNKLDKTIYTGLANDLYYVYNVAVDGCIVCTDITNVCGTIVGVMPSSGTGVFDIGGNIYHWDQWVPAAVESGTTPLANNNCVFVTDDTYSNFWSFYDIGEDKNKAAAVKAMIDYGFKIT